MAKKVSITTQGIIDGRSSNIVKEIIVDDDFELFDDYYAYQIGAKTDPNGNAVQGAMIGPNHYIRFVDVIDISVEIIPEEIMDEETEEEQIDMVPIEPSHYALVRDGHGGYKDVPVYE